VAVVCAVAESKADSEFSSNLLRFFEDEDDLPERFFFNNAWFKFCAAFVTVCNAANVWW
jgi:hypothetical protein